MLIINLILLNLIGEYSTLEFINTFAICISALGTFTAAFVALYISNRNRKISLRIYTSIVIDPQKNRELLINVVNKGLMTITVNQINFYTGLFEKHPFTLNSYPNNYFFKINYGEEGLKTVPIENIISPEFINKINVNDKFLNKLINKTYITIHTTTSKPFKAKLSKNVRKTFYKLLSEDKS